MHSMTLSTRQVNVTLSKPRAGCAFNNRNKSNRADQPKTESLFPFWKYDVRLGSWQLLKGATPHKQDSWPNTTTAFLS